MAPAGAVRRVTDGLLAALLAPACACCGEVLESPTASPVCGSCWRRLERFTPPVCDACGEPLARLGAHGECAAGGPIARARALGAYEGVLRDLIHAIKYGQRRSLGAALAVPLTVAAADVLRDADALVPVPLHPWRSWTRGFNQADDLARALASGRPVLRALRRTRATRPQSALDADARRANVARAIGLAAFTRRGRRRLAARIAGRVLLLVDDVTTTGATLEACAGVLLAAGAREVRAVTLARTLKGRHGPA